MQKPNQELEAEFNKSGIFFLPEKRLSQIWKQGERYIGVQVDIDVLPDNPVSVPDFSFDVRTKRGVSVLFTDWGKLQLADRQRLSFDVWVRCPDDTAALFEAGLPLKPVGMTFQDLCFYVGNEAIPETFGQDVFTQMRPDATKADLGWLMPVRLADPLIDSLGKMNDAVLAGMLQESILYGVKARIG
jgi:hypothetical protein